MAKHKLTWLGHSSFLLEHKSGKNILLDPWLEGNPSYPENFKIPQIDLILLTHAHSDHIGSVVDICKSQETQPQVVCIFELGAWLEKKGCSNLVQMNKGGTVDLMGLAVSMVHAQHSSGILEDDGTFTYGGEAAGFVVKLDEKNALYFAGDTNVFSDMALIQELYEPNIACLPVGDHFTMGPKEFSKALEFLNVETAIPMHFGTFDLLTGKPEDIKGGKTHIITPEPGKVIEI